MSQDDPLRAKQAAGFFGQRCSPERPGFVNRVVLAELVWVSESRYDYDRAQVAGVVDWLLRATEIAVEDAGDVAQALGHYRSGADFADVLIGISNSRQGCSATATFDRKARRLAMFEAP